MRDDQIDSARLLGRRRADKATCASTTVSAPSSRNGWLAGRKQAAAYCGVGTRTINRWMHRGAVKYRKLSPKLVMFRPQDLDAAVETLAQQYEKNS